MPQTQGVGNRPGFRGSVGLEIPTGFSVGIRWLWGLKSNSISALTYIGYIPTQTI